MFRSTRSHMRACTYNILYYLLDNSRWPHCSYWQQWGAGKEKPQAAMVVKQAAAAKSAQRDSEGQEKMTCCRAKESDGEVAFWKGKSRYLVKLDACIHGTGWLKAGISVDQKGVRWGKSSKPQLPWGEEEKYKCKEKNGALSWFWSH